LFLTAGKENYKTGDIIFKEGSHGVAVYLIESGKVEISKDVQGQKLVVETLGPGEMLGEMSFIDGEPRSATATALEDTVLELLDKDFIDSEFNRISSDFRGIVRNLVKRLRNTTQKLTGTAGSRRAEERTSAKIRINFKSASDFFRAYIGNLGTGGLFIKTTQTIPAGTILNLEFNLPDSDHFIQAKGKVIWARSKGESDERKPPGLGIQFVDMNSEDNQRLRNYIATFKF
jgi:CRP/FNR family transcriptional regulator, cyclic AMP receptor protein